MLFLVVTSVSVVNFNFYVNSDVSKDRLYSTLYLYPGA